ncbi:MAG TPA: response regulator [Terriglobales bacterium]|nr:response regulator [Terriglobales bacterium]
MLIGTRALIVDPDEGARTLLDSVLVYCGAQTAVTSTAREALAALDAVKPDVIIAAVSLPGEDGYWLVRTLQEGAVDVRTIRVVAVATRREDSPDRTLAAGFHAHVTKPVDPWELCRIIASITRKA